MFGSIGMPELLLILVALGFIGWLAAKRGGMASTGPVLVLRKFEIDPRAREAVTIEGRPSGIVAWLLTTVGLDTLTRLTVSDQQVSIRKASLSGELNDLAPLSAVSHTRCSYTQPIWVLILGAVFLLGSMLGGLNDRDGAAQSLVVGILLAGVCALAYFLQRKIVIRIFTSGSTSMGLAFKPSVIEHVTVNLSRAMEAIDCINAMVVASAMRSAAASARPVPLVDAQASIPDPGRPSPPRPASEPRCRRCSAILGAGLVFCTECGAKAD